jgi:gas vesicle protein
MARQSSGIFTLLIGATVGLVAGILLAPKSGKETREDLKKMAGEVAERAKDTYSEASAILQTKLAALKKVGKKIDKEKYITLVNEVVEEIRKDGDITVTAAKEVGINLKKDWVKVRKALDTKVS